MRLAVVSAHTCPLASLGGKETGGMNVYVRESCAELGRRGIEVDIFTRSQDPGVARRVELRPGVNVHHVPAGPVRPYPKYELVDHLEEFVSGILERASGPYDLIHTHYWISGMAGLRLRDVWKAPVVHMFHTMGWIKNLVARRKEEAEGEIRMRWEYQVAREADGLVAPHPLERAQLVWHYGADPGRIKVIPCGVDTSLFRPMNRALAQRILGLQAGPWIIFVGRLDPIKGLDTLMEAMALLGRKRWRGQAQRPSVLVVGGSKPEQEAQAAPEIRGLMAQARALGIEDMVRFVGPKSQDSLALYYGASSLCVLPSRYESFGMAALEAMACGIPVVASRVGGLSYTVLDGQTGLLVPEGNAQQLADTMERLLRDGQLRRQMGTQAVRHARRFSWPRVVDLLLEMFQRLLEGIKLGSQEQDPLEVRLKQIPAIS